MSYVVTYRIRLEEPAVAGEEAGDPNSAASLPYLPGSALRGGLVGRHGAPPDAAADPDFRRLFLDGQVRCLNAYPVCEDVRSLPVPLSWLKPKGDDSRIQDFAVRLPSHPGDEDETWQGVRGPFWALRGPDTVLANPARHIATHTARSRRYGRARPGDGAVFRYDALASGQEFAGAVVCDGAVDADSVRLLLTQSSGLRLGKSLTGGYGAAWLDPDSVSAVQTGWRETEAHDLSAFLDEEQNSDWTESEDGADDEEGVAGGGVPDTDRTDAPADGVWTLTLLSDALVRDGSGQHAADACAVARAIESVPGWASGPLAPPQSFLAGQITGGFNQAWGLPLLQALAVRMGSVFVFASPPPSPGDRERLETLGLGERRAEGFGRVAVDWLPRGELRRVDATSSVASPIRLTGREADAAGVIAGRLFEQRLEERLEWAANRAPVRRAPSGAQIGRMRDLLHVELRRKDARGRPAPDVARVQRFLEDVGRRGTVGEQYRQARVLGEPLDRWLQDLLGTDASDLAWQRLGVEVADVRTVGGVGPARDDYWSWAVLRYLDMVLGRAAKQGRGEDGDE